MKKTVYLLIAGTVLSLSACKSSKNAYKEAYEKAVEGDAPKAVIEERSKGSRGFFSHLPV